MQIPLSQARDRLGHLVARAQDPREVIVLTRHGKPLAALVSIPEARRIWDLADTEALGHRPPLSGRRAGRALSLPPGLVEGRDGKLVTRREAALQVQELQMSRRMEREILAAGGLEPVTGGEIGTGAPRWPRLKRLLGRMRRLGRLRRSAQAG
ncbi:type II toxin-antitoxin system Phd/YefM family antitoxin [Pseudoruegeria sp. SHC-113]|uniref:type II toxin-antitoxin system Phd/YefM family antitoxin n=1 Tax=Pseudoruegeria sp. SHC-113 TaxID=2855439 RepID=UPI0021BBB65C|nr:type II toxin-antitoxin system Phd/YefM family antitoxin [Pseudoruegeria sp. SHC-113]MCT8159163.1 type II toxin-antitoxin system Phd/YefM family antitoxin [Pseudoruegeria sp. SHC-113]